MAVGLALSEGENMMRCAFASVWLLASLIGCQTGGTDDPLSGAMSRRELSADFLKKAGAPLTYVSYPFTDMIVDPAIAGMPIPTPLPTKPRYVVELTKVEEVRTAWMGGKRITVIRHPYVEKAMNGWSSEHPQPPSRLNVRGNYLSGCGPVSIWTGAKYLHFTDAPWVLLDVPGEAWPWLMTVHDNLGAGGPMEIGITTAPGDDASGGLLLWLDRPGTGRPVEMVLQTDVRAKTKITFVQVGEEGKRSDIGQIAFDSQSGRLAYEDTGLAPVKP